MEISWSRDPQGFQQVKGERWGAGWDGSEFKIWRLPEVK
jgi:hypothetical protein